MQQKVLKAYSLRKFCKTETLSEMVSISEGYYQSEEKNIFEGEEFMHIINIHDKIS